LSAPRSTPPTSRELSTTAGANNLAVVLARLAPAGVATAVEPVPDGGGRSAEHAAGQRAGQRAVAALGATGGPIGAVGDRPAWPDGVVGSVSHAGSWAAAVAASTSDVAAIGLDLDREASLPAADATAVCSAAEQFALAALPAGPAQDSWATLLWVAKEAAFKAWDPWCDGRLWGVDPVLLSVDVTSAGWVIAHPAAELDTRIPGLPPLRGGWSVADGLVVVVLAARQGGAPPPAGRLRS
jgi:4'-phosphopantetheinyl transferase EntD